MDRTTAHESGAAQRAGTGPRVLIIGAGAAGLCLGVKLRSLGYHRFTILERGGEVGGTWRENTYPGAACDVPSHFYCFSFEHKGDWTRAFAGQPEILDYFRHVARKYGLYDHIRFGAEVRSAAFDEKAGLWRVQLASGEIMEAEYLASGVGQLNRPYTPDMPGLSVFQGETFHSARWNHDLPLVGRHVAVIGNGASAVQFVPRIAPTAASLTLYQRSANWIIPRPDRAISGPERFVYRHLPWASLPMRFLVWAMLEARFPVFRRDPKKTAWLEGQARDHLSAQVKNPALREKLTPDYPIGCKRVLISDDFYPALERPNVTLVTEGIDRVAPDGILTQDGTHRPHDTIIFATGFRTTDFLGEIALTGRGGRRIADDWAKGAEAYLGIMVAGYPNFFMMYGPNTNLGHNSILYMIEHQVNWIGQVIARGERSGVRLAEISDEAQRDFNKVLQAELAASVWAGECGSWYKNASGRITNNWWGSTLAYARATARPDPAAFAAADAPART